MGTVIWDVDDRPASVASRIYIRTMRIMRDKQAFEGAGHTRRVARKKQARGDRPPTRWTRFRCHVVASEAEGMAVWTIRPRREAVFARVVYLHGGGYVHPLTGDYWKLMRSLAMKGIEVVVPIYPLAPDAVVDEVLPDLTRLTEDLDRGTPTVLMGDSAGGAMVIAVALLMRSGGSAGVAGLVALCPWLDATLDDAQVGKLESSDPMLAESGLRAAGRWWAGDFGPTDPLVSPVRADLDGLPPIDILIGDRDILRPAVDTFAERARRSSVSLHVHEVPAMFHVWMTRAIPEGRRTRRHLVDLVRRRAQG